MKNFKYIVIFCLVGIALGSCRTSSTSMQVLKPAEINIPAHVKTVVVINRSLPLKEEKWKNIIEGFITGETIMGDREGSNICVSGLVNELNSGPRFKAIVYNGEELKGTGTREFPLPLDWNKVQQICQQNQADAIVVLETFDSDIMISQGSRNITKKVNGKDVPATEFLADLRINVNAGWRVYDNVNKQIIDQKQFVDNKAWNASGDSPERALSRLPMKRGAINDAGAFAGMMFGKRISPNWVWVQREYFVKKHDDFKKAKSYVKAQQWQEAAKIWSVLTNNADPKTAGRACYNMALACEVDGNLQLALVWAQKALEYNCKKAKLYINILTARMADQQRLDDQMQGVGK